jgi:hypothetical protein
MLKISRWSFLTCISILPWFSIGAAAGECVAPTDQLVAWWPGDGHARDIQGNNHGTAEHGATFKAGLVDHAFVLDGVNDYISVPDAPALDLIDAITLAGWVKPNSATGAARVIAGKSGAYQLSLGADGHANFSIVAAGLTQTVVSSNSIPTGAFTHLAGTYDASTGTLKIYVNGALDNTWSISPAPVDTAATPFEIGARNGGAFFAGMIDEVLLFKTALSQSDIADIQSAGADGLCKRGFRISALTTKNLLSIDEPSSVGAFGTIVSPLKLFTSGTNSTEMRNASDLSNPETVQYSTPGSSYSSYRGLIMNLRDQKIYNLAQDGNLVGGGYYGTITFNQLAELDPQNGLATGQMINLSQTVTLKSADGTPIGFFPGYDRVVLTTNDYPGAHVYNIDLPSGRVSTLGDITAQEYLVRPGFNNHWATWGVAEFFDGAVHLVYMGNGNNDQLHRINVATNEISLAANIAPHHWIFPYSFAAAPLLGRWFTGFSLIDGWQVGDGSVNGTLVSADAAFSYSPAKPPTIANMPKRFGYTVAVWTEALGPDGAVIKYHLPTATDRDGKNLAVTCSPASGTKFPITVTAVTCSATDAEGNTGSDAFYAAVYDTKPPKIKCPKSITVKAPKGESGTTVNFEVSAVDTVDGAVPATADPPSGSFFPKGKTKVQVLAGDSHNNGIQKNFVVTVK